MRLILLITMFVVPSAVFSAPIITVNSYINGLHDVNIDGDDGTEFFLVRYYDEAGNQVYDAGPVYPDINYKVHLTNQVGTYSEVQIKIWQYNGVYETADQTVTDGYELQNNEDQNLNTSDEFAKYFISEFNQDAFDSLIYSLIIGLSTGWAGSFLYRRLRG